VGLLASAIWAVPAVAVQPSHSVVAQAAAF